MYGLIKGKKALVIYFDFVLRDTLRRDIEPELQTILDEISEDEQSETEEDGKTRPPKWSQIM